MYFDGCKYGKGGNNPNIRKFKLTNGGEDKENEIENTLQDIATLISPLYEKVAPDSYKNMTTYESIASDCRIGRKPGRPFSGVTAVSDFCAHAHRDTNNMNAGCTLIVSLLKPENRDIHKKPDDEQLHVLPHYSIDDTDEYGTHEGQYAKVRSGQLEILKRFERSLVTRSKPRKGCKRGHPTGNRKKFLDRFLKISKTTKNMEQAVQEATAGLEHEKTNNVDPNVLVARPPKRRGRKPKWMSSLTETSKQPHVNPYITYQHNPTYQPPTPQSMEVSPVTSPIKSSATIPTGTPIGPPEISTVKPEAENFTILNSDCSENFGPDATDVGGVAIALTHGSVAWECALKELHATTALRQPNRFRPTRIGLIFYQHKNLNNANHGYENVLERQKDKNSRDYEAWKEGKFIPTSRKLQSMKDDGFCFPDNVLTVPPGTDMNQSAISKPDLSFLNVVEKQGKPFRIGDLKNSSVTWTGTPNSTTTGTPTGAPPQPSMSKPDYRVFNVVEKQGQPFRIGDLKNSPVTWPGTTTTTGPPTGMPIGPPPPLIPTNPSAASYPVSSNQIAQHQFQIFQTPYGVHGYGPILPK